MIKKVLGILLVWAGFAGISYGQETITVVNAQGPTQSMTPQILAIVDEANRIQTKYKFVVDMKPGGFESIGVKHALQSPNNRVVTITNSVVEAETRDFVNLSDVTPLSSQGDACWAVITNFGNTAAGISSIPKSSVKEITVGGPAIGGAAHLIALEIGKKYNLPVRYIVYRSNFDALVNMSADDNSVNFVMDRLINYKQFREKNNKIQALGVNCVERVPEFSNIKTLKEQGLNVPYIWQYTVASKNMDPARRQEISDIINRAMLKIGKPTMFGLSDFISPVFYNESAEKHWDRNLSTLRQYRKKYEQEIKAPN